MSSARLGASDLGPWYAMYARDKPLSCAWRSLKPGIGVPHRLKMRMMASGYASAEGDQQLVEALRPPFTRALVGRNVARAARRP